MIWEEIFTPGFAQLLIAMAVFAFCACWVKWAPGRF